MKNYHNNLRIGKVQPNYKIILSINKHTIYSCSTQHLDLIYFWKKDIESLIYIHKFTYPNLCKLWNNTISENCTLIDSTKNSYMCDSKYIALLYKLINIDGIQPYYMNNYTDIDKDSIRILEQSNNIQKIYTIIN